MYVRVVVDAGSASMFDAYTYSVPEALTESVAPGVCVLAPLGSREVIGYVIDFQANPPQDIKTKDIISVVDSPVRLSPELFRLAQWLSTRYLSPLPRCLRAALPRTLSSNIKTMVKLAGTDDGARVTPVERQILDTLADAGGELSTDNLKFRLRMPSVSRQLLSLRKKGLVDQVSVPVVGQAKARTARAVQLNCSPDEAESTAQELERSAPKRAALLRFCATQTEPLPVSDVLIRAQVGAGVVSALAKLDLLSIVNIDSPRTPAFTRVKTPENLTLNKAQQSAVDSIVEAIDQREHSTSLLFGVTASGKTEVYLRALGHALSQGLGAIVLVPEISLTTQVVDIFKSRLGSAVAVAHSSLSTGERFDEWRRIDKGDARIVVGARSAIFAPVRNLGLVIVDEEHEPTYKQDIDPRYNARNAAIRRAQENKAAVVLGSATPSVESYFAAMNGRYTLISLPDRALNQPMPVTHVVDLREEMKKAPMKSVFSERLVDAMSERISRGEQIILFQNRRAYATFLLCRDCGFVMHCPHCAVALKYHRASKQVKCHHCDHLADAPTVCPQCESSKFGGFGIGTERVEEEMRRCFPDVGILRMDRDTTSARGSHAAILNRFRRREAQVLIGTQMVAKGLDFPGVTLVGVISADTTINMPDFRAAERTFQLLSQVAGRAGRGSEPGEVVIQTFFPEHYAVQCALSHDYVRFYQQEIKARRELNYPPFSQLISIVMYNEDRDKAESRIDDLASHLRDAFETAQLKYELLGPSPCAISRLRGEYRYRIIIKSQERQRTLAILKDLALGRLAQRGISIDVDPTWML